MKQIYLLTFTTAFILLSISITSAQKQMATTINANANACESNSAAIDGITVQAQSGRSSLRVLSRPGSGETGRTADRRLQHVRRFLNERKGWNYLSVVYADGARVRGQGRLEVYANGQLQLVILAKKNFTPCMDCCGPDPLANPRSLVRTAHPH